MDACKLNSKFVPFNWMKEYDVFLKEVCEQMNCVSINDLIIDNKEIFHVFHVTDNNDDQFVADIDKDENSFNIYNFRLTETVSTMMRTDLIWNMQNYR